MNKNAKYALLAGAGAAIAGHFLAQKWREIDLQGQVVLITGGSRGLGLAIAREFGRHGSRLAICARSSEELTKARENLQAQELEVFTAVCDVADPASVEQLIAEVTAHYGRIDILVCNAGIISVAPVQNLSRQDFEETMAVNFWGVFHSILAVIPQMRQRKSGRIVTITSIGGKVAFPHLLPYACAKFAATGLSEGLRAELDRDGIVVTTIIPGLLRTGSYLNASFQGDKPKEFAWFGLGDNLPGISISAERAAREIVQATRRGEAERILSLPANLLARGHCLLPGQTIDLLKLVNRFILPAPSQSSEAGAKSTGKEAEPHVPLFPLFEMLTTLGHAAAKRLNQG